MLFVREDEGQGLVEYALIIAVIAVAVIVAMVFSRGRSRTSSRTSGTTSPSRPKGLVRPAGGQHHQAGVQRQLEIGAGLGAGRSPAVAFWRDDQGQGLVEYALIISVIAIAVIVAMVFLRGQLQNQFSNIGNNLT